MPTWTKHWTTLAANRDRWVQTTVAERIAILAEIKECLMPVAQAWAETAARKKGIPEGSPLEGEEWISGPYTVMGYCNQMMATLSQVAGKHHLERHAGSPARPTARRWRGYCLIRSGTICCSAVSRWMSG